MTAIVLFLLRLAALFVGGALMMFAIGLIHSEILSAVHPAGLGTSTLLLVLLRWSVGIQVAVDEA